MINKCSGLETKISPWHTAEEAFINVLTNVKLDERRVLGVGLQGGFPTLNLLNLLRICGFISRIKLDPFYRAHPKDESTRICKSWCLVYFFRGSIYQITGSIALLYQRQTITTTDFLIYKNWKTSPLLFLLLVCYQRSKVTVLLLSYFLCYCFRFFSDFQFLNLCKRLEYRCGLLPFVFPIFLHRQRVFYQSQHNVA